MKVRAARPNEPGLSLLVVRRAKIMDDKRDANNLRRCGKVHIAFETIPNEPWLFPPALHRSDYNGANFKNNLPRFG